MTVSPQNTTWMRRYTLDPALADEFIEFFTQKVAPARGSFGFEVESAWLSVDKTEMTWFVSHEGDAAEFAAAEKEWENSTLRAEVFAGAPQYVVAKSLGEVSRLR